MLNLYQRTSASELKPEWLDPIPMAADFDGEAFVQVTECDVKGRALEPHQVHSSFCVCVNDAIRFFSSNTSRVITAAVKVFLFSVACCVLFPAVHVHENKCSITFPLSVSCQLDSRITDRMFLFQMRQCQNAVFWLSLLC
jgi:hypothetical protein